MTDQTLAADHELGLRSMGCPYTLEPHQITDLGRDSEAKDEVTCLLHQIGDEERLAQKLGNQLSNAENSLKMLQDGLIQQNQNKTNLLNAMGHLHDKISKNDAGDAVERLMVLLESFKDLERQDSHTRSLCLEFFSDLQAAITILEDKLSSSTRISNDFGSCDLQEKLDSRKHELAVKLRDVMMLKKQIDDVPSPSELIQYERRFSELYVQIQEKHRQTRKYYATYNALLEIKELVLKETSLLNSINLQFEDAITSPAGRTKLIDSMEGIIKGAQQKLRKVQDSFEIEQKVCESLKDNHAVLIAEQRRCSSILKAFQEEYTKNERLRSQMST